MATLGGGRLDGGWSMHAGLEMLGCRAAACAQVFGRRESYGIKRALF